MDESKNNNSSVLPWLIVAVLAVLVIVGAAYIFLDSAKQEKSNTMDKNTGESVSPVAKEKDPNQFNWSTMSQGPYLDNVSYATGTSLTSWVDSKKILAKHASVPDVINKNGVLHLYFVDVTQDGKPEQIGHMQSNDGGETWGNREIATITGLGDKIAVDPCPYLLPDGRIRLYYLDISTTRTGQKSNNVIYSAVSEDGINFTEEPGVRFSYADIFDPDVINVDGVWRMYVGTGSQKVLSATSADGITFTYEGVALDGGSIPNVIFENNKYYLYTGGIEISTSSDGKTFTKSTNRFDSGKLTADPGVAKIADNKYIMVYKTSDVMPQKQ